MEGQCSGRGEPTCCQLAPPSSEAMRTFADVSGARTPHAACLHGVTLAVSDRKLQTRGGLQEKP